MRIHYLSYGIFRTGGYRHEMALFQSCSSHFSARMATKAKAIRKHKLFQSPLAWIQLLIWAFINAGADINIVTARTAVSAILRNLRSNKQVWIVLHNFDPADGKSDMLSWYYKQLFRLLRKARHKRFKVIAVAPYWQKYFSQTLSLPNVFLFPNLFNNALYKPFAANAKNAWVHLGQFSSKNDPDIYALAKKLSRQGYYCYFSTLNPLEAKQGNGQYDVLYFLNFSGYLEHMSRSCCTLALPRLNEGWNRIAHESMLCGTPVVGYARGGLGDLLKESSSVAVKNADEAYSCIVQSLWVLPGSEFLDRYDISKAPSYIEALCRN